ncbi:Cytochrome C biogenesis protein transmembrane region family [unidentified eubacterium SCB49]|nr:Cytochrome C biogenesis protein transmembrane region family [unidentified eubacterium SCB49]
MKLYLFLFLLITNFSSEILAQDAPQSIQINGQSIIKDPQGNKVSLEDFMGLMESKEWTIEPMVNDSGQQYIQLVKLSKEEQKAMVAMQSTTTSNKFNGIQVPYFNFIDRDGNIIKTDNTKNKVVVFNFWFATCPPCIKEIPELNEVYEKYKNNKDIVFAAITFEKEEKIVQFQKKYNLKYPIVGREGGFSQAITRGAYPTNVIIKRDGTIQEYISGGMIGIGKQIEAAIEEALLQ